MTAKGSAHTGTTMLFKKIRPLPMDEDTLPYTLDTLFEDGCFLTRQEVPPVSG